MAKPIKPARYMRDKRNPIRAEKKRKREAERAIAKAGRKRAAALSGKVNDIATLIGSTREDVINAIYDVAEEMSNGR